MLSKLRSRLTYANVISSIALFCALAGGAYAATQLPKNSVGAKQLKKSAVTSPKVKDGTLLGKDFKAGQLPAGPRGEQGPEGKQGAKGETGARGPSNAYNDFTAAQIPIAGSPGTVAATLTVPAGNWVLVGRVNVFSNNVATDGNCTLRVGSTAVDIAAFALQADAAGNVNELPVSLQATTTVSAPATIQMICEEAEAGGTDIRISERHLTAIQVETLTQQ